MSAQSETFSDLLCKADAEYLFENAGHIVDVLLTDRTENENFNTFNETPDVKVFNLENPPIPKVPLSPICNEDYEGPHNFEVCLIPNGSKNPWVYSHVLNKIFIDMGSQFPIDFKISSRPSDFLYIRATPVFSLMQHAQELVYRCIQHEQPYNNQDVPDHVRQHIVRCNNPEVTYFGDKNRNERLNLVFPLGYPHTGADSVREMFSFVCKNSCPTGMNRKPIEIVFTLENGSGEVLGRRVLNVRVCSCPKRDKEKEEKEVADKGVPRGKKRKLEKSGDKKIFVPGDHMDTNKYELNIPIIGKHNVQSVLKYCHDLMAGEIVRRPHSSEPFKLCLQEIANKMTGKQ
uniref:Cellular tumor antigen p53 n=1 Tax=Dastarcus helophoroides TaxID=1169899 RepID=A0A0M4RPK7_9CUCU|nr:cellular tumor antigen p53 [Dastarcus helophoroides]